MPKKKYVYFNVIEDEEADGPFNTLKEAKDKAEEYNEPDLIEIYKGELINESVPRPDTIKWKHNNEEEEGETTIPTICDCGTVECDCPN